MSWLTFVNLPLLTSAHRSHSAAHRQHCSYKAIKEPADGYIKAHLLGSSFSLLHLLEICITASGFLSPRNEWSPPPPIPTQSLKGCLILTITALYVHEKIMLPSSSHQSVPL